MSKVKIEIKNRWTGSVLFEYEKENNTLKETLEKAIEEGANLEGANLKGANLKGTNLKGANLKGTNLEGTNLEGTNLEGANLEGASLEGAYLRGAYLIMWDNIEPNIKEIIENIEANTNLRIKNYYINKHVLSPVNLVYWKNGLIVDEYEIVEPEKETSLNNGDKVKLNPDISNFKHGKGSVRHGDIGVIIDIDSNGDFYVDFPNQKNWHGLEYELIKVEAKEMTIKEIEEALGYSVKVVKENEE